MRKDLVEYESSHGIDVNYKKFALVLKDELGNVIGVLNAFTAFSEIYVDDMWVDSSCRGKGYGRKLLQELENHFEGKGFNNINLVTSAFIYNRDGLLKTLGIALPKMPRQIIDMTPSFLVRSLDYYRALESHRGDQHENEIITMHPEKGIPLSSRNLNPISVSCWSYYKNSDLDSPATWQAFPEDTIAAIESTVGDIKQIIDWIAPTSFKFNEPHIESPGSLRAAATHHGKIIYYSPKDDHKAIHENYNVAPLNCFFKRREPYLQEREYRFIILFGNHLRFSPEMFAIRLKETNYIKTIYLKNNIFTKDELQILDAYYGHLIKFI